MNTTRIIFPFKNKTTEKKHIYSKVMPREEKICYNRLNMVLMNTRMTGEANHRKLIYKNIN